MKNTEKTMDKIVALCKNRGFIFAGSEIYGGLANTWDYGPLGVELKNNVKKAWWKKFVQENPYNVGLDAAILMNPQTWVASGHLSGFSDPLMDCRECKERFRADKLIEDWCQQEKVELPKPIDAFSQQEMKDFIEEHNIPCPSCGKHNFTDIRQFNLMFKTFQGVTEDAKNTVYLRPETAQGIFTNFVNTQRTTRRKLPFGVCQIGKSFRNEITPGNFIFRVREFEQMELEFFCKPGTDLEWFQYWRTFCHNWLLGIGLKDENLRLRDHDPEELCFYSKATTDFEFLFPFGWGELWGVADRTDYDLTQHQNVSGEDMSYFDDALFIGDSRTEGFMMYSGVDNATYYAYKGLSVRTAFTKNVIRAKDGSMTTVENALKQQSFGKVYIMLGINELGWPNTDVFIEEYSKLIDTVKATSPNAIIYIQLIMPVSEKKAGDAVYNNDNINRFNTLIKSMVKSKEVYYVDPGEAVSADGWLVSEATTDGIHLNKDYCIKWRDYLMSHTVQK